MFSFLFSPHFWLRRKEEQMKRRGRQRALSQILFGHTESPISHMRNLITLKIHGQMSRQVGMTVVQLQDRKSPWSDSILRWFVQGFYILSWILWVIKWYPEGILCFVVFRCNVLWVPLPYMPYITSDFTNCKICLPGSPPLNGERELIWLSYYLHLVSQLASLMTLKFL